MSSEEFKADDLGQIQRIKVSEDDLAFFLIVTEVERIRKLGHFIWAFPIKWRDESGKTYREEYGYEIEFEDGRNSITYGYSGQELFETYSDALRSACQQVKEHINQTK